MQSGPLCRLPRSRSWFDQVSGSTFATCEQGVSVQDGLLAGPAEIELESVDDALLIIFEEVANLSYLLFPVSEGLELSRAVRIPRALVNLVWQSDIFY